jgi:transcriptional regulator with XRE-family HTH domain
VDNAKFVERVRDLCKEQKTSITKLEAQLDFSNGYIGKWAKRPSSPPYEKLTSIAQALGVTVEELTGEEPEQKEKPSTPEGDGLDEQAKSFAEKLMQLDEPTRTLFNSMLDAAIAEKLKKNG